MPRIVWVRIPKFCAMTGETDDSVRSNIAAGNLKEGRDWAVAPDGTVLMLAPGAVSNIAEDYQPLATMRQVRARAVSSFKLPVGSGIYFLFFKRRLEYVGQSASLMRRIGQHMAEGVIAFDSASWINCEVDQLSRLESAYIKALRPTLNQRGKERNG